MTDPRIYQLQCEIDRMDRLTRQLRTREEDIKARTRALAEPKQFATNSVRDLKKTLDSSLGYFFRPSNVGGINEVSWPFWFQASVDFGQDPTISRFTPQRTFFQVDQEACLLLMGISVMYSTDINQVSALQRAPISVLVQDRQSSRFFMNNHMPVQVIGDNSNPSVLPCPMFMYPSGFVDIEVRGINETPQTFVGSGQMQFSFFGLRCRVENAQNVLSTIFHTMQK